MREVRKCLFNYRNLEVVNKLLYKRKEPVLMQQPAPEFRFGMQVVVIFAEI